MDQSFASSSNVTTSKSEPTPLTSGGQKGATPSSVKSLGNDKVSSTPSGGGATSKNSRSASKTSVGSGGSAGSSTDSPYRTSDFYIIRVSIEENGPETEGVIMYKSIMIANSERTPAVIRSAMMKHGLEGSPENFTLSQLLPENGELLIPPNANVYYAINTQHDLNFVLRQKNEDLSSVGGNVGEAANSATASDSKRRPQRDTSKARRKLLGLVL